MLIYWDSSDSLKRVVIYVGETCHIIMTAPNSRRGGGEEKVEVKEEYGRMMMVAPNSRTHKRGRRGRSRRGSMLGNKRGERGECIVIVTHYR